MANQAALLADFDRLGDEMHRAQRCVLAAGLALQRRIAAEILDDAGFKRIGFVPQVGGVESRFAIGVFAVIGIVFEIARHGLGGITGHRFRSEQTRPLIQRSNDRIHLLAGVSANRQHRVHKERCPLINQLPRLPAKQQIQQQHSYENRQRQNRCERDRELLAQGTLARLREQPLDR